MSNRSRIGAGISFLVVAILGCHTTPKPKPMPVMVINAETRQPVAGATVHLSCPDPRAPGIGKDGTALTGPDGVARVRAAAKEDLGLLVGVSAPGYLTEVSDFRTKVGENGIGMESPGHAEHVQQAGALVIEVFSGPRPTVELILPEGFRGIVKAEVKIQETGIEPGKRSFSFVVPSSATFTAYGTPMVAVTVVGPPVLKRGLGPDFQAHYPNQPVLRMDHKDMEIGFRWLRSEGDDHYYVVGTQTDWNEAHRAIVKDSPQPRSSGGGSGGGGGGRHGGGRGGSGGNN